MLSLQHITYFHPDKELLFDDISFSINKHEKIALVGNNGSGKSTLLKILAGELQPSSGTVKADAKPYYIPQLFGQHNDLTIAQALQIDSKLNALKEILAGNVTEANMNTLDDNWTIEERCYEVLANWQLEGLYLEQKLSSLSGGQKTKVFLAGIDIHQPEVVLMDEPSNHLDAAGRMLLYNYVSKANATLIVVSHDRTLLNLLNTVYELSKHNINIYGGNYEFYREQKAIEAEALNSDLRSKEKALRKAREIERETIERQQKLDARGRKKQDNAGVPTIMLNTLKNNAEKSTSRIKDAHAEKTNSLAKDLNELRKELPDKNKMKIGFDDTSLHRGKVLLTARDINYSYDETLLWQLPVSFQLTSGKSIAIKGANGSGKTTLIKIIMGALQPTAGNMERAAANIIYIDQDYTLIQNAKTVYEQALAYNTANLPEHEVKSRLTHFLFTKESWDKSCDALSGGERMRLILCCLTLSQQAPDIIILDEPTNNLDLQNIEILTNAISDYKGTLVVVSHDAYFLEQIGIDEFIQL
ncbi:MAG: ABC-F family ATP-binding cassette domain-containing protein [Sphingobacteriales bacterium]|nr:MAG: ABC-F family ATP-binding cassette domain-containing protein [Sphingobacteriales bacterium]